MHAQSNYKKQTKNNLSLYNITTLYLNGYLQKTDV